MKNSLNKAKVIIITIIGMIAVILISSLAGVNLDLIDFSTKSSALGNSGQCGENVFYTFDENTGTLVISGEGDMYDNYTSQNPTTKIITVTQIVPVTTYGQMPTTKTKTTKVTEPFHLTNSPFYGENRIKTIIIEQGVTKIGNYSFANCSELKSITICNSVSSIGNSSFYNCSKLNEISIPEGVTSIGDSAFNNCTELSAVNIPDTVTRIGNHAFSNCNKLNTLSLGNSIKTISEYAFYNCSSLTDLLLPDSVENINDCAFNSCSGLISINLGNNPDLKLNYNVFDGCDSVESYFIGANNLNYVTDCYGVLYNKDKTGLIKYPAGNNRTEYTVERNTAYINENAFENSRFLKNIDLPNDIISMGEYSFQNCTHLERIVIPDGTDTVCYAAFDGCTALKEITLPENLNVLGNFSFNNCVNLEKVYYNSKNLNTDEVRRTCFYNCGTNSTGIDFVFGDTVEAIPEELLEFSTNGVHIIVIGSSNWNYDYDINYPKIKSVTIGKNVKQIGNYAFYGLASLTVFNFNAKNCESMNYAIVGCNNLSSINIGDSVEQIPKNAFSSCTGLTSVTMGNSVTSVGNNAFSSCIGLTSITIPENVETISDYAFKGCTNLKNVVFNSDDYINIGNGVFDECYNAVICCKENSYMHYYADRKGMQYCIIDEGGNPSFTVENDILVSYTGSGENIFVSSASKIGFAAFDGNENLKSVELASNVTRIYNQAFRNCSSLEKIVIPKSVTSIGSSAFSGCDNLTIWCYAGSYAQTFAENHDFPYTLIKLDLSQTSLTAAESETLSLTASFTTDLIDEDKITWTSSDTDVAVVENGVVNILDFGEVQITASTASGLSAECLITVDAKLKPGVDAEIDREENLLSGADIINKNPDEIKNMFANSNVEVSSETSKAGTGSTVTLYRANGGIFKEIEILIYGDVNSDGVYDAQDAFIVNCIANGMLTREQVGEAKFLAADCNHDGEVNSSDVLILEQAGLLLSKVEQAKDEEMKEQALGEYLDLIDQNPEINEADETTEEKTASIFDRIIDFVKKIIDFLKSILAKF